MNASDQIAANHAAHAAELAALKSLPAERLFELLVAAREVVAEWAPGGAMDRLHVAGDEHADTMGVEWLASAIRGTGLPL